MYNFRKEKNMEKKIVAVDIYDKKIGMVTKEDAHKNAILHRAFSVFLYHDGKLLIQQRAFDKYHSGGLWANTCCSHPRTDSIIEEAKNRLVEEVGIKCEKLDEIFVFNYFSKYKEDIFEYEVDHVLIGDYDGNFVVNKDEVNDMRWVTYDALEKEMTNDPQKFSTWFLIAAPRVLKYLKNK